VHDATRTGLAIRHEYLPTGVRRGYPESDEPCGMNEPRCVVRSRRATPIQAEEDQMVKVTIAGLIGAFVIFYIMTSPDQAATMVKGTGHLATNVAHGVGNFLDKLSS
jgi:hypothetical protein